jgi:hypothetical protein
VDDGTVSAPRVVPEVEGPDALSTGHYEVTVVLMEGPLYVLDQPLLTP